MLKILPFLTLIIFSQLSYSAEISSEKRRVIDEMLEITGALEIADMMATAVTDQMIAALAQQKKDLDPRAIPVLQDEVRKFMYDEFIASGFMAQMSYEIYDKYFTIEDLRTMLDFYKTPVGIKVVTTLPQVTQEAMIAGQQHGVSLGPAIQSRLKARFEEEGLDPI